jgi:uncharacterized protein VirK/YbjX
LQFQILLLLLHSKRNNQKLKLNKMKVTISNSKGQKFPIELTYSHKDNFAGSWIINIDVMYEVDHIIYVNRFEVLTTRLRIINDIKDLRNENTKHEVIELSYHYTIYDNILEEQIIKWIESLIKF